MKSFLSEMEKTLDGTNRTGAAVTAETASEGLFSRILRRPRQVWLRRVFFQVHLWVGVLLALYMFCMGTTGALLVFKEKFLPQPSAPVGVAIGDCEPQRLIAAVKAAKLYRPGEPVDEAWCPTQGTPFYAVILDPPNQNPNLDDVTVFIHPASGAVVGEARRHRSWIAWVERFHTDLLGIKNHKLINGIAAAALFVLVITGAVLWWPGIRNWAKSLRFDLRRHWKRFNWDLHTILGMWTLLFTLTCSVTAMSFAWPESFSGTIGKLSPLVTARYPRALINRLKRRPVAPIEEYRLETVVETAHREVPDQKLEAVAFDSDPSALLTVYMAKGRRGDLQNSDFAYFDQRNGHLLYVWRRAEHKSLGDWVYWLLAPIHFGRSWNVVVQAIWALCGLSLPVLSITGLIIYWNRFLSKKLRRATS